MTTTPTATIIIIGKKKVRWLWGALRNYAATAVRAQHGDDGLRAPDTPTSGRCASLWYGQVRTRAVAVSRAGGGLNTLRLPQLVSAAVSAIGF